MSESTTSAGPPSAALTAVVGALRQEIELQELGARDRLDGLEVDADHAALAPCPAVRSRSPAPRPPGTSRRAPRPRSTTRAPGRRKRSRVVDADQLVGGAAAIALALGRVHEGVVQLPLEPQRRGELAPARRPDALRELARAAARARPESAPWPAARSAHWPASGAPSAGPLPRVTARGPGAPASARRGCPRAGRDRRSRKRATGQSRRIVIRIAEPQITSSERPRPMPGCSARSRAAMSTSRSAISAARAGREPEPVDLCAVIGAQAEMQRAEGGRGARDADDLQLARQCRGLGCLIGAEGRQPLLEMR